MSPTHYAIRRLDRMVDASDSLFVLVDADGTVLELRGHLNGSGSGDLNFHLGRPVEDLLPDVSTAVRDAIQGEPASYQTRPENSDRILNVSCEPFEPDPELDARAMLQVSDVTLRVQAQRDLRLLHDMGREIEEAATVHEAAAAALPLTCERLRECCVEFWWPEGPDRLARRELFQSSRPDVTESTLRRFPEVTVRVADGSFVAETLHSRSAVSRESAEERDPALRDYLKTLADEGFVRSLSVSVPLLGDARIVLVVYLPEAGRELDRIRRFLETQATELGLFLARRESELVQHTQRRRLRALSVRLSEVREEERKRFSRAVHDTVGHELGIARFKLSQVLRSNEFSLSEKARGELEELETLLKRAIHMARDLTTEFSPPILNDVGLFPALRWVADGFKDRHGIRVELSLADELEGLDIAESLEALLFHSVQECLLNVVHHAEADRIDLSADLSENGGLRIRIDDNGRGFPPENLEKPGSGFGLFSIRQTLEHAGGRFECDSSPGGGTRLTMHLPHHTLTKGIP